MRRGRVPIACCLPAWIVTLALTPALARAQAIEAAPCTLSYHEYGDAPEGFRAYLTVPIGHFPTCTAVTPAGTQEIECGTPLSSPPELTGHVQHIAGFDFAPPFWLGCGSDPPALGGIDGENEAKSGSGDANACGVGAVDCSEPVPWGLVFGQDECLGDADAGVDGPIEFTVCTSTRLRFRATLCELDSLGAWLNVLVDWNMDGDWNDVVACTTSASCAPEWAVKNVRFNLTRGCRDYESPQFVVGSYPVPGWMRVTLTGDPVHDGFPWSGSVGSPNGNFRSGETEDHPVMMRLPAIGVEGPRAGSELQLGPAVPSPSRRGFTLRYVLARSVPVRAEVLDARGRRVRLLAGLADTPGDHRLAWDGRDEGGRLLPSGLYLIRVEAGVRTEVRRAVHLR